MSTWLHIPECLALGKWSHHHDYLVMKIFFIQFFCVFLPPLLNIFCFFQVHTLFFIAPIFAWNVPLVSLIFLKSSLVFPILFFSCFFALIAEEGFLISPCYSLNSAFRCLYLSFSPLLFTSLLFTAICKASPVSHFAFLHFFSMWMVLLPVSCTV